MEAIRDMTWMLQLPGAETERIVNRGFDLVVFAVPATASHHENRYRYRLLAFAPAFNKPVLAIDLESDILGDYCFSLQEGGEYRILARYDECPSYADFRTRALAVADERLEGMARIRDAYRKQAVPHTRKHGPRGSTL